MKSSTASRISGKPIMARQEEPREDLLREATALVQRVELESPSFDQPIVAGFRRDGAASFFFGQTIVYQFNTEGQIRRGYLGDRLYKAECGRLVQLTRQRTADEVQLVRHELTAAETAEFLSTALKQLQLLGAALSTDGYRIIGQVPNNVDIVCQVQKWLAGMPTPIAIADSPRVV